VQLAESFKLPYRLSLQEYYYALKGRVKPFGNFSLVNQSLTEDGVEEKLEWIPLDKIHEVTLYPEFFKTHLYGGLGQVQHFVTREN